MAFAEGQDYLAIVELDGQKRVIKASSGPNIDECRRHVQQMNPKLKILEIRRVTSHAEIEAEAEKIRADPNYTPIGHIQELAPTVSGFVDADPTA